MASDVTAVRGHAISFSGDPFFDDDALVDVEDALIVSEDGSITAFGPYDELRDNVPDGVEVVHYPDALLCAGFVDIHIHYVQTGIIGASGSQLIDWLNEYTFIEEQRFAGTHMLGFTIAGESVSAGLIGSASAIVNGICFIVASETPLAA